MKLRIQTDETGRAYVELPEQPPPAQEIKPGRKTTEAVATLLGMAAALAVAKGWLTSAEADLATQAAVELYGAVAVVAVPSLYALYRTLIKLVAGWKARRECR